MEKHTNNFDSILKTAKNLVAPNDHFISKLANMTALIKEHFDHHWVGFYLTDEINSHLYLGPFQGPMACTTIPFGKGACGQCWEQKKTLIVDNVYEFPGHITCSPLSNSEIVIPVFQNKKVIAILDIDSVNHSQFTIQDQNLYENLMSLIASDRPID